MVTRLLSITALVVSCGLFPPVDAARGACCALRHKLAAIINAKLETSFFIGCNFLKLFSSRATFSMSKSHLFQMEHVALLNQTSFAENHSLLSRLFDLFDPDRISIKSEVKGFVYSPNPNDRAKSSNPQSTLPPMPGNRG